MHTDLEMERGSRVQDNFQARDFDNLVKGAGLGNVGHNDRVEPVLAQVGVGIVDFLGLFLRADGSDDRVTPREKRLEDVGCRGKCIVSCACTSSWSRW